MTKNEIIQKNIALSFDFIRRLVENQDLLQAIPNSAEIDFIEHDLPISVSLGSTKEPCKTKLFQVEHIFKEIPGA